MLKKLTCDEHGFIQFAFVQEKLGRDWYFMCIVAIVQIQLGVKVLQYNFRQHDEQLSRHGANLAIVHQTLAVRIQISHFLSLWDRIFDNVDKLFPLQYSAQSFKWGWEVKQTTWDKLRLREWYLFLFSLRFIFAMGPRPLDNKYIT